MEGAPRFISKVLHLCDGVGWREDHWCYRSGDAPPLPSGQQMFLFVPSLLNSLVFFFSLVDGDACEFSQGATYHRGERVPLTPRPLSPPPRLLGPLSPDLSSLKPPSPQLLPASHLSPSLSFVLLGFRAQIPQSTKQISPWGGRKQETLYLFCMCIII